MTQPKRKKIKSDPVNHPKHYGGENSPFEVIKIIEHWELGFSHGNVLKYLIRAGHGGSFSSEKTEDLRKAQWYLNRIIQRLDDEMEVIEDDDGDDDDEKDL